MLQGNYFSENINTFCLNTEWLKYVLLYHIKAGWQMQRETNRKRWMNWRLYVFYSPFGIIFPSPSSTAYV